MRLRLQLHVVIVVSFLLLLTQACMPVQPEAPAASEPPAAAATTAPELETVRVATLPFITFAPFYIAQAEGFFAEQGLNVELVALTPQEIIPALAAGEVDVASGLVEAGIFNATSRDGGMKIVADKGFLDPTRCNNFGIYLSSLLEGQVSFDDPETLKGQTVNMIASSWLDFVWHEIITPLGVTDADLEYVVIPNNAQAEALSQGTLDIAFTNEPWITVYKNAGHIPVGPAINEVLPNAQFGITYYSKSLVEDRADVGNRFMVAYLKAARQYNEGATDRNVEIMAPAFNMAQEALKAICWPALQANGEIDVDSILAYQEWAQSAGYLDGVVPAEEFWDGRFVEAAQQELGAQ